MTLLFKNIFQSYQDDGNVMAMQPRSTVERFLSLTGLEPGTARSTGQCLTLLNYRGFSTLREKRNKQIEKYHPFINTIQLSHF